jgi:acylphosphatase
MVAWHVVITGRVQGVGYRAWICAQAEALCLSGWVRNSADGSVEAVIAGAEDAVGELLRACRKGPRAALVCDIAQRPYEWDGGPGFQRR